MVHADQRARHGLGGVRGDRIGSYPGSYDQFTRVVRRCGNPLQANNRRQREYPRSIKAAGVKSIKFHWRLDSRFTS